MKLGGSGLVRVDQLTRKLTRQSHVEVLTRQVRGTLGVPGGVLSILFNALLDIELVVTSVSGTLVR